MESSDSYLNYLNKHLGSLTSDSSNLTGALQMAEDANTDSAIGQAMQILEMAGEFQNNDYVYAGTGNDIDTTVSSSAARWSRPAGISDSMWKDLQLYINGTLNLYISEIVPGAEKYVLETVLPAVNTVSDTTGIDLNAGQDAILKQINEQSIILAYQLMSIDGEYSLTSMIPHVASMYYSSKTDGISGIVDAILKGLSVGEYVGALQTGTATNWNDSNLSGDGVAYPNFSLFNSLYLSYSKVLITALYGYAMVGKYDAMQAMYDGTLTSDMTAATAANAISTTAAHTGAAVPTGLATTTYQQGFWDTYHYVLPFYQASLNDISSDTKILRSKYSSQTEYENAVWNRVNGDSNVNGGSTTGILGFDYAKDTVSTTAVTLATTTDPNEPNPHENATVVSEQTKAYLVSFYEETVGENQVSYQLQPVVTTQVVDKIVDADGNVTSTIVYNTIDEPIGDPTAALTGAPGDAADTSTLPDTATDTDGTVYNKPTDLSSVYITENGGLIDVSYHTKEVNVGAVSVHATGEPVGTTFDYTIYNADGSVASSGTIAYSTASAGTEFNLTDSQYVEVTPATAIDYTVTPGTTQTLSFADTINGINSITFVYAPTSISYTIQPVYQSGVDADGKPVYTKIGTAKTATGVPGDTIDERLIDDITGYTTPTYDATNVAPVVPALAGAVVSVIYTVAEVAVTVNLVDSDGKAITQTYDKGSKQGTSQYNVVNKAYTAPTVEVEVGTDGTVSAEDVVAAINADDTFVLPQKYVYTRYLGGEAVNYRISATQIATAKQDANGNWTVTVQMDTPIAVQLAIRAHNKTSAYGDMGDVAYDTAEITNDDVANKLTVDRGWMSGNDGNQALIGYVGDTYNLADNVTFVTGDLDGRWDAATVADDKLSGTLTSAMDYTETQKTNADGTLATTTGSDGTVWQTMNMGNTLILIADESVTYNLYGTLPDGTKTAVLNTVTGLYNDEFDKASFISDAAANYVAVTSATNGREMVLADATAAITTATTALTDTFTYDASAKTPGMSETDSSITGKTDYTPNVRALNVAYAYVPATVTVNYYTEDSEGKETSTKTDTIDSDYVTGKDSSVDGFYVGDDFSSYIDGTPTGYSVDSTKTTLPVSQVVSEDNNGSSYDVYYTPSAQTLTVNYVDDNNAGVSVATDTVSGVTDESGTYTASTSNKIPAGYKLADGQDDAVNYTFTTDDTDNLTIHLVHVIGDPSVPDPGDSYYDETHKTVSREITYDGVDVTKLTDAQKAKLTDAQLDALANGITQTGSYTRTVSLDEVTGDPYEYGLWTLSAASDDGDDNNDGFTAVTSPIVPGYTVDKDSVDAVTLSDSEVESFVAKSQDATVTYTDGNSTTTTPTDPTDPNYDATHKTVSRDITYDGVDVTKLTDAQKAKLTDAQLDALANGITQTGSYTRTVTTDNKTGDLIEYGAWTLSAASDDGDDNNDGFTAVTSPVVPGYTVDKDSVDAVTLSDSEVESFVAKSQDATVTYTDGNSTTTTPTDPTDPNYDATHKTVSRTITYKGVDVASLTPEQLVSLTDDELKLLQVGKAKQTGTYTRTVTTDKTTGALIDYGDWTLTDNTGDDNVTNDGFTAIASPVVPGYTATPANVDAVTLDDATVTGFTDGDDDATVVYAPGETTTVTPTDPKDPTDPIDPTDPDGPKYPEGVDENDLNKTVSRTVTFTGLDVNSLTPEQKAALTPAELADLTAGKITQTGTYTRTATVDSTTGELVGYGDWTLTDNTGDDDVTNDGFTAITSPVVPGYTATPANVDAVTLDDATVTGFTNGDDDTTVVYAPGETTTVTPTDPKDPTDPIDPTDPDGPKYPAGVDENDLNKTVSRTVTFTGLDVNTLTPEQKAALTPAELADLTAGKITQTGTYTRTATVDSTTGELVGYGDWTLTDNTGDDDVTNDGFTAITSPVVPGYTTAPANVDAVTLDDATVTGFTDGDDDATVVYTPGETTTVTPKDPKDPTDPIDPTDPDGPKYPEGVDENDLNKTVSRTITYTGAGDKTPAAVTQTAIYQRTATVDSETGELVGYGDWTLVTSNDNNDTNDGFTAVTSPKVLGYTADKNVPAVTLDNRDVTSFAAKSDDQTVTYTFDGSVEVTEPTDPTQPVDPNNPDGPKMPEITADDLNQNVSRTITYEINTSDDPNTPTAPATVTQTANYKRSALVDAKTGELLGYTDWIVDGTNKLVEVDSPKLENYVADPTSVAEVTLSSAAEVTLSSADIDAIRSGSETGDFDQTVDYTFNGTVTKTTDPDGGTTTVTKNPDGDVTDINKTWPDGDKTHVHVDTDTGKETVTETPNGQPSLPTVTVDPGNSVTVGKTTVHNEEPDGVVSMTHEGDNSGEGQLVETIHPDGSITYSYIKNAQPTANTVLPTATPKLGQPTAKKVAVTQQANKKLPQTDEHSDNAGAVVGMSLLGMILGWVGFKRKKRDED